MYKESVSCFLICLIFYFLVRCVQCETSNLSNHLGTQDVNGSSPRIFLSQNLDMNTGRILEDLDKLSKHRRRKRLKKKYQKYLLPLLLAYKLKFLALIPILVGGLVLLGGSAGLAGFFFALFAAVLGLKASVPKYWSRR